MLFPAYIFTASLYRAGWRCELALLLIVCGGVTVGQAGTVVLD